MLVDVNFDVRSDANGKDPDQHSPTLRRFHKVLWSKELPIGERLELFDDHPGAYLYAEVQGRPFTLSSDGVIPTFTMRKRLQAMLSALPQNELEQFRDLSYKVGAFMIFPSNCLDGRMTINGAKGFNSRISDRFDLTLECIRRHFSNDVSPLSETLDLYRGWFELFVDFRGFVDFFLLQDFIKDDYRVDFHMPFDDFKTIASPPDLPTYLLYKAKVAAKTNARSRRIAAIYGA